MHTRATHTDIKNANEKLHSIPANHGNLTIETDTVRIEIDWLEITIDVYGIDQFGGRIVIDISGRGDDRKIEDILIGINDSEGVEITMPQPYHTITIPLKSIERIKWEYPHEEGWSGWDIFKSEKI